ncbi:MAG: Gfo/Idh/MocA family oxidoreductase [Rikenellaceae bacterium]|nr:Gfo/Idh/MocA family oxidoreductase [Rikenellaceae bacterium]
MKRKLLLLFAIAMLCSTAFSQQVVRIGIIGLDTSHSTAFTELINGGKESWAEGFKIVAAYPYGSRTIESSYKRIPDYIEKVKAHGVKIVDSIDELLKEVDCVLLETNDGNPHLEQAIKVFRAGKPCFIDKPLGATLADAIALYAMADKYGATFFSSSALRFTPANQQLRRGEAGEIIGADCYSPHSPEPTHPDFGFYGIHGVETLYTILGTGCNSVSRVSTEQGDVVTGAWKDGRIGTFRAIVKGPHIYGGTAYTTKQAIAAGGYVGYKPLLQEILNYFRTGKVPVSKEETIEIFAFMKASNMSKERDGDVVTIDEAMRAGEKAAKKLIKKYDK